MPKTKVDGRLKKQTIGVNQLGDSTLLRLVASQSSLAERMAHYNVPACSVAIFEGGELTCAGAYGSINAVDGPDVDVETLFQAASMSKVVNAIVVFQLVADGVVTLDEDVNVKLRSWHVAENDFTKARPVTLRRILNHRAGLTVHGFPGFAENSRLPSLPEILSGAVGALTEPVFVDILPESEDRYSGGGITVAQLLVEDVTGLSFADVAQQRVFGPLGLCRSTFRIPLPEDLARNTAHRHGFDGAPLPGRWNYYPQMAAAGLWTTPTEFGRILAEIRAAWHGRSRLLDRSMANEMLTRRFGDDRGLGVYVYGDGDSLRYFHDGNNSGFHCAATMYAGSGQGAVVMTNALQGRNLWPEYFSGAAHVCGWPAEDSEGTMS